MVPRQFYYADETLRDLVQRLIARAYSVIILQVGLLLLFVVLFVHNTFPDHQILPAVVFCAGALMLLVFLTQPWGCHDACKVA